MVRKPYRDPYIDNLLAGDEIIADDKEYKIATLEEAEEFAKKRNHYTNTDNPIDFPGDDNEHI